MSSLVPSVISVVSSVYLQVSKLPVSKLTSSPACPAVGANSSNLPICGETVVYSVKWGKLGLDAGKMLQYVVVTLELD